MTWNPQMEALGNGWLFHSGTPVKECEFCGKEFRQRWQKPTEDETFGRYAGRFCCATCLKLWREEQREMKDDVAQ